MTLSPESLKTLNKQLAYCNADEWIAAGHNGKSPRTKKGTPVWRVESATTDHGTGTSNYIKHLSPECELYEASKNGSITLGYTLVYDGKTYTAEEFIKEKGIKVMSCSIGGKDEDGETPDGLYWKYISDTYKVVIFNSIGNDGTKGASCMFPSLAAKYVCACGLNNGVPVRKTYSSVDPEADYINFTGYLEGTSFACPWTAGEAADIIARYDDDMHPLEVYWFLDTICKDVVKGSTNMDGKGLPVLPEVDKKFIRFIVGDNRFKIDGDTYAMDTTPVNMNGTVFVPLRACCEALGKDVTWDAKTKTATIIDDKNTELTQDDVTMKLTIGSIIALIDDEDADVIFDQITMTAAPFIDAAGRTMVPLRFISENFECVVGWIQSLKEVLILQK